MISGIPIPARSNRRPMRAKTHAHGDVTPDHENKSANRPIDLTRACPERACFFEGLKRTAFRPI